MATALIPAAIGVILKYAPSVADWIFGDKTGAAVKEATDIVKQVFGTEDPDAITAAIATDPNKALELQKALIEAKSASEQRAHDELMKRIEDVTNARNQTVELSRMGSPLAWGAALVSVIVLGTFGWTLQMVLTDKIPVGQELTIGTMLGALTTMATAVVGYWVGSTAGSAQKTNLVAQSSQNAVKALTYQPSIPMPIASTQPTTNVNVSGPTVRTP